MTRRQHPACCSPDRFLAQSNTTCAAIRSSPLASMSREAAFTCPRVASIAPAQSWPVRLAVGVASVDNWRDALSAESRFPFA